MNIDKVPGLLTELGGSLSLLGLLLISYGGYKLDMEKEKQTISQT